MLGRVLSKVPSGKDEGKNREVEHHTLCIQTGGIATSPKEDSREGEAKASSPRGKKGMLCLNAAKASASGQSII